jgi:hypothetical protein
MALPKGKFFKVNAAKVNRDGSVTLSIPDSVMRKANPKKRRNVAQGFMAGGVFHPIRSSYDYDPERANDDYGDYGSGRKPAKRKAAAKKKAAPKRKPVAKKKAKAKTKKRK